MNLYTQSGLQKNLQLSSLETVKILLPKYQQLQCSIELQTELHQGSSSLLKLEGSQLDCSLPPGRERELAEEGGGLVDRAPESE